MLPHLRQAIWSRLLEAQRLLTESQTGWCLEKSDFDADDREEVLLYNRGISFGVSPGSGGCCFEFSLLSSACNLANTLTRREESDPHKAEPAPQSGQAADGYERHLFQERFFSRHTTTEELAAGQFRELGNFLSGAWMLVEAKAEGDGAEIELERLGGFLLGSSREPLRLTKKYVWKGVDQLTVKYRLRNEGGLPVEACFAVENNFYLPPGPDGRMVSGGREHGLGEGWYEGLSGGIELQVPAAGFSLKLESVRPFSAWSYPVFSAAETTGGGIIQQGNALLCGWPVSLQPDESVECELSLNLVRHEKN